MQKKYFTSIPEKIYNAECFFPPGEKENSDNRKIQLAYTIKVILEWVFIFQLYKQNYFTCTCEIIRIFL